MGKPTFGAVSGQGIVPLGGLVDPTVNTLRDAIEQSRLIDAAEYAQARDAELSWADVTLLPVIPDPSKILCIGLNYQKHKIETGRPDADHPTVFTRFADSQVAHGQPMAVTSPGWLQVVPPLLS